MELVNLSVMYLMFFSVRATFQNITTGCYDGYYRNETSGTCIECPQGYKGPDCSVSCVDGFYGKNCQHKCPSTCLNCNVIDGSCRKDCPPGYTGPNCSVPCVNGLYGKNCQHKCSSTCSNCNSIDGKCPKECPPGHKGSNCSVPCVDGFYGKNCQHKCPSTCLNCSIIDGSCPKDMTNTTDTGDINASNHIIKRRNISASYIVTTFGCATAVALLLVLIFYTYKLATQPLPQNFTFTVHDPESDAERNTVNPASGSIYENV